MSPGCWVSGRRVPRPLGSPGSDVGGLEERQACPWQRAAARRGPDPGHTGVLVPALPSESEPDPGCRWEASRWHSSGGAPPTPLPAPDDPPGRSESPRAPRLRTRPAPRALLPAGGWASVSGGRRKGVLCKHLPDPRGFPRLHLFLSLWGAQSPRWLPPAEAPQKATVLGRVTVAAVMSGGGGRDFQPPRSNLRSKAGLARGAGPGVQPRAPRLPGRSPMSVPPGRTSLRPRPPSGAAGLAALGPPSTRKRKRRSPRPSGADVPMASGRVGRERLWGPVRHWCHSRDLSAR